MKMTRTELDTLLRTLNCQVFYNHTTRKDTVNLPFIVYLDDGSDNMFADNITYQEITDYSIILHSTSVDSDIEGSLKTLLTSNGIPFERNEPDFDEDLLFYTIVYEIRL